ncbi:MAG: hypothetical protein WC728_04315 [Elusimicrobiota bacterium]
MDSDTVRRLLTQTRFTRPPKRLLSTFGTTRIEYHLLSPVEDLPDRARLREGVVVSERPQILTPESLRDKFEGFGEQTAEFSRMLSGAYGDALRALEYKFRNTELNIRVLSQNSRAAAEKIREDMDSRDVAHAAVIECADPIWGLVLMRFTVDEAIRSFPANVRDLDRRGLFSPDTAQGERLRRQVEALFERAAKDPGAREILGARLRETGLFHEYEDRFLALFA